MIEEEIQLLTVPIGKNCDSNPKNNSSLSIKELLDEYSIESITFISKLVSKESREFSFEYEIYIIVPIIHNINKDD